jgi:hypothetical protein
MDESEINVDKLWRNFDNRQKKRGDSFQSPRSIKNLLVGV